MGRSTTPTFALIFADGKLTDTGWDTKNAGRPTDANIKKHLDRLWSLYSEGGARFDPNDPPEKWLPTEARVIRQINKEEMGRASVHI